MRAGLLIAILCLTACGSPCKQVRATRCNGSVVELCGSNLKWQRVMDCAEVRAIRPGVSDAWVCKSVDGNCTCVAVER